MHRIADAGKGAAASAAPTVSGDSSAALRKHFAEVSALVLEAADLVPADKYSYRPAPTVRTFGELVGHIADSYRFYCGPAGAQNAEPSSGGAQEKAALTRRLTDATSACTAPSSTADAEALIGNIAHTNLHYGNMVTYLRMLGLVPHRAEPPEATEITESFHSGGTEENGETNGENQPIERDPMIRERSKKPPKGS